MAPDPTHAEIAAELAHLRKLRMDALAKATFVSWTPEEMALEESRLKRIDALQRSLDE